MRVDQHSSINCFANDHYPGCDTDPAAQFDVMLCKFQVQLVYSIDYCKACMHRAACILFVCLRVTKVGHNAIADVSRNNALVAPDRRRTHILITDCEVTQVLWI